MERDSIINISIDGICPTSVLITDAYKAQKGFFDDLPEQDKMTFHNDLSYSGYVFSGEEDTAGNMDAAEIFTVTPGFDMNHSLVKDKIPCHGPVPWPSKDFENAMKAYADAMRDVVEKFREQSSTDMAGIGAHTE